MPHLLERHEHWQELVDELDLAQLLVGQILPVGSRVLLSALLLLSRPSVEKRKLIRVNIGTRENSAQGQAKAGLNVPVDR